MSLYAVMEPVQSYGQCQWVRTGAPTQNLLTADQRARRKRGRVIDLNTYECLSDFWVEPEPKASLGRAEYRQARAIAHLFQ